MALVDQNGRKPIGNQGTLVSLGLTTPSKRRKTRPLKAGEQQLLKDQENGSRGTLQERAQERSPTVTRGDTSAEYPQGRKRKKPGERYAV
jgi:hypothetical protein